MRHEKIFGNYYKQKVLMITASDVLKISDKISVKKNIFDIFENHYKQISKEITPDIKKFQSPKYPKSFHSMVSFRSISS